LKRRARYRRQREFGIFTFVAYDMAALARSRADYPSKRAIRFCAGRPSGCSHTDERADGDGSRMIVDAGVDAAALARVPQILQRR